ncbi:MAG: aldo/keto reductase [Nitrospira sp.]|nr:aldo/keto reductase [Nitrospira sp.]
MTLTAYNNVPIPSFMYGTAWKKEATTQLVQQAVAAGFTAIDTANQLIHYQEALVGEALVELAKQGVSRDRLFLQTKFTPVNGQDHRTPYDAQADFTTQVTQSFDSSLVHLHTDYVDSYVLHGPYGRRGLIEADWEVWAAIEALYTSGKTKMIGISNVTADQLTLLCARATHKPMVVQNRCYAALGWDQEVRAICRTHNIIYQGFSLLTANGELFRDSEVRAMAVKYGMGLAQLVFRFAMQIGMLPLTGTTNPQHMQEDLQSDQFTIAPEDLQRLEVIGM